MTREPEPPFLKSYIVSASNSIEMTFRSNAINWAGFIGLPFKPTRP